MVISKEAKIGIMVSLSLIVMIAGSYYLKGFNLFSADNKYYCYFDNIDGLTPSSSIQANGMVVGNVSDITLEDQGKIKVTLSINKKIKLHEGTTASVSAPDLMSSKVLKIDLGKGAKILENEATIESKLELGLFNKVSAQVDPAFNSVNKIILRLDSVMASIQHVLNPNTEKNLENAIASMELTMKNFASLSSSLNKESGELAGIIHNTNKITENVANNSKNIDAIVGNLKTTTDKLSKADLEKTIARLQSTLEQAQILMSKINSGDGSLGMLANDKMLYQNLSSTMTTLEQLLADVKKHPSRYINIRVFGKAPKEKP